MVAQTVTGSKLQVSDGLVVSEIDIPKRTDVYLNCSCGGELIKVSKWEDEPNEIYLTLFTYMSERYSFWERLKFLFGGKTKTASLVIDRDELDKLKDF